MKLDTIKIDHVKTIDSFDMKLSAITSNKSYSFYEKLSIDLTKLPLLKLSEKDSHASQFIKHMSSMNLEGDTLLQHKKWWYAICYAF